VHHLSRQRARRLEYAETSRTSFSDAGVLYLKGDWTNRDPAITAYLAEHGRNGVPLYVFYPPDGDPQVLPQILTEDIVRRAIR
jgi:thiol:disulfide interchange protein